MNLFRGRIQYSLIMAITLVCVMLLILFSLNASFSVMDDFNIKWEISRNGLIGTSWKFYNQWDGRSFSPAYLFRNFILSEFSAEVATFITTLIFLLSAYICLRILNSILNFELRVSDTFVFATLIGIFLWLSMRPHLSRSFYWVTGSYYVHANLLLLAWYYFLIRGKKSGIWLLLLLSFALPLSGVNLAGAALTMYVLYYLLFLDKFNFKEQLPVIVALVIGTLISVLAPGNYSRLDHQMPDFQFDVASLPNGLFTVLKGYLVMSKWVFFGSLALALVLKSYVEKVSIDKALRFAFVFFGGALASVIPFMIFPERAMRYTAVSFQTLLFLGLVILVAVVVNSVRVHLSVQRFAVLIPMFYFLMVGIEQFTIGLNVKQQINQRYSLLESHRGTKQTVVFRTLSFPEKLFLNRAYNEPSDSTHWVNKELQRWFDTGSIIIVE